jgi:ABC-2 type transport system ATP-binding protein
MNATIAIDGLRKRFGSTQPLDGMTFTAHPGQVTGFIGPNGAGNPGTALRLSSRAVSVGAVRYGGDDDRDLLIFDQV